VTMSCQRVLTFTTSVTERAWDWNIYGNGVPTPLHHCPYPSTSFHLLFLWPSRLPFSSFPLLPFCIPSLFPFLSSQLLFSLSPTRRSPDTQVKPQRLAAAVLPPHIGLTFLVPAHTGSPGQRAVKRALFGLGGVLQRVGVYMWHKVISLQQA